jgi:hypothetical protein
MNNGVQIICIQFAFFAQRRFTVQTKLFRARSQARCGYEDPDFAAFYRYVAGMSYAYSKKERRHPLVSLDEIRLAPPVSESM